MKVLVVVVNRINLLNSKYTFHLIAAVIHSPFSQLYNTGRSKVPTTRRITIWYSKGGGTGWMGTVRRNFPGGGLFSWPGHANNYQFLKREKCVWNTVVTQFCLAINWRRWTITSDRQNILHLFISWQRLINELLPSTKAFAGKKKWWFLLNGEIPYYQLSNLSLLIWSPLQQRSN